MNFEENMLDVLSSDEYDISDIDSNGKSINSDNFIDEKSNNKTKKPEIVNCSEPNLGNPLSTLILITNPVPRLFSEEEERLMQLGIEHRTFRYQSGIFRSVAN